MTILDESYMDFLCDKPNEFFGVGTSSGNLNYKKPAIRYEVLGKILLIYN